MCDHEESEIQGGGGYRRKAGCAVVLFVVLLLRFRPCTLIYHHLSLVVATATVFCLWSLSLGSAAEVYMGGLIWVVRGPE